MSSLWHSLFLILLEALLCATDLIKYDGQNNITCSQGLKLCTVDNMNFLVPSPDVGPVEVLSFNLEPALCCEDTQACKPCVRIQVHLRILPVDDVSGETPDDTDDEGYKAALTLCYASVPNLPSCNRINFFVKSNTWKNQDTTEVVTVVVYDGVFLGSSVNVSVNRMFKVVHVPPYKSVCPTPNVEECKTPRIISEIDKHRGVVELKTEDEELLLICRKRKGMMSCLPSDWTIPLHAITHCTCFQAWRNKESSRSEICPFENDKGIRRNAVKNVSLSVHHTETNEGRPALSWNMSAPCRLEVEAWPCQVAVSVGGGCREMIGFRQNISIAWEENSSMVWTSGMFLDVRTTNNLLPCVMFKVDGEMFGPVCERDDRRGRWTCVALVVLLLLMPLALGLIVFRNRLKEWLSSSNPTHQSRGLLGEVLLVYSSGSDPSFTDTVCWFATWLSELGFSVSLDLWDQAAVNSLGLSPWLHSSLKHVQTHGGKTLLLLSDDAVLRAREWYEIWSVALNREDTNMSNASCMWNSDVFGSALSSLFSARLKGSATEHFALVQLQSEVLEIPELFRGLRLYQLPSESQRLLADLHSYHPGSFGAQLKRFLWTWRASVRLKNKLRSSEKELRPRTESTLTQVEALSIERDEEEMVPLQV